MEKFTTLTAIAAPLPITNVDTDMIIPKQFLKTIKRTGLKEGLFYEMRHDIRGNRKGDFILDKEPYTKAQILVSGENFGCGSSREHAPWALLDFGIKVILARSFADIFYNNCFKNGMLPIPLPLNNIEDIMEAAYEGKPITVDLEHQKIKVKNHEIGFTIDQFRKHCLINGLDDIGLTLEKKDKITEFEKKQKAKLPWLYAGE